MTACAPDADESVVAALEAMGARFRQIPMGRASLNPLEDAITLVALIRLLREERPDIILAYTQKPIIYAGLAHRIVRRGRFFPMVTGLGYVFSEAGRRPWLRRTVAMLYRAAVAKAAAVIVFNRDDRDEMRRHAIVDDSHILVQVPGSGIDTAHFTAQPLPQGSPVFLLIARLLYDKGLREYAAAAEIVRRDHPGARFQLLGPIDPNPAAVSAAELARWQERGIIEYLGHTRDVRPFLAACSVFVLPSYREGMPRTVLEAMATGRAIITTDAPGCRDTVREDENGFLVPVGDIRALASAMARFCREPPLAEKMGQASLGFVDQRFGITMVNQILMNTLGLMLSLKDR